MYLVLLCLIFLYILYFTLETPLKGKQTLEKDGLMIFRDGNGKKKALENLPSGYLYINYKYTIKGCTLPTFHRDVTSSQYVFRTKYPVYTYIEYKNKGALLSVCPGSHKTIPFLFSRPKTIYGDEKTGILFNCDLVHAGAISNLGDKRFAEQYKICHIKDLGKMNLEGINTKVEGNCNLSPIRDLVLRKGSLIFCYITNHVFTKYLQNDQKNWFNKIALQLFGNKFYNK